MIDGKNLKSAIIDSSIVQLSMGSVKMRRREELIPIITTMVTLGNVDPGHQYLFVTDDALVKFGCVFTHKSFDSVNNYELFEFWGDAVINEFIDYYIMERFPKVISIDWLTKLTHYLKGKQCLASISKKYEFDRLILSKDRVDTSMMEDAFEAFFGCIMAIITSSSIDGKRLSQGIGVNICHNILRAIFDKMTIRLDWNLIKGYTTQLKELYESPYLKNKQPNPDAKIGWPFDEVRVNTADGARGEHAYEMERNANGRLIVRLYAWPLGNKLPERQNRVLVAKCDWTGDEIEAKEQCARIGLVELKKRYNLALDVPDPYQPTGDKIIPRQRNPC